jgi:hypothetical protein
MCLEASVWQPSRCGVAWGWVDAGAAVVGWIPNGLLSNKKALRACGQVQEYIRARTRARTGGETMASHARDGAAWARHPEASAHRSAGGPAHPCWPSWPSWRDRPMRHILVSHLQRKPFPGSLVRTDRGRSAAQRAVQPLGRACWSAWAQPWVQRSGRGPGTAHRQPLPRPQRLGPEKEAAAGQAHAAGEGAHGAGEGAHGAGEGAPGGGRCAWRGEPSRDVV